MFCYFIFNIYHLLILFLWCGILFYIPYAKCHMANTNIDSSAEMFSVSTIHTTALNPNMTIKMVMETAQLGLTNRFFFYTLNEVVFLHISI